MSVLSTKASVISRFSDFLQFRPKRNDTDVLGNQAVGSVTISQMASGFYEPNVQSALDDLHNFATLPLNAVIVNTDGISPGGVAQVDIWSFSGTVTGEPGKEVIINVYGIPVKALVGDTAEEFKAKAKLAIQDAATSLMAINTVQDATLGNELQISYLDNQVHNLQPIASSGISTTVTTLSEPKVGYGSWLRIGAQTVTFDGGGDPVILYYFKRIA